MLGSFAVWWTNRAGPESTIERDTATGDLNFLDSTVLPGMPEEVAIAIAGDPAHGVPAPSVEGTDFDGLSVEISQDGRAKAIYFLGHWCPHCNDQFEVLMSLADRGEVPESLDIYVVSTANDQSSTPPLVGWLAGASDHVSVVRDDDGSRALRIFGGDNLPYVVYLDQDHHVRARSVGRLTEAETEELWQEALGR